MTVVDSGSTFGDFLRQLRRRAALTQSELAAQVGFSVSHISLLESNARLPDVQQVRERFAPALGVQNELRLLHRLVQLAAHARGEAPSALPQSGESVDRNREGQERALLPAALTNLVGRQKEIERVGQRLMDAPGRLLTLTGPPGVGKSRLAWAVAERLEPLFAHGVSAVDLAALGHPTFLADALVGAVGLNSTSSAPPEQRLVEFLRRRELLLLLDNFDLLLTAASDAENGEKATGLLVTLLRASPGLRLLATSRSPLRLRFEQRYKVQPLSAQAAAELFIQRMQAVEPEGQTSEAALPVIAEICRRLDCLPLAVELIAARSDLFSPQAMLARLENSHLELLSDGPTDLPAYQRTLRGAIQRSYDLLAPDEQALFRGLSIFVSSFDLRAAEEIFAQGVTVSAVHSLIVKSLVRSVEGEQGARRYQILETLRAYALEQLDSSGEAEAHARRHAHYYRQLAEGAAHTALRTGTSRSLAPLMPDLDNLRAALGWLLAHEPGQAQRMVGAMRRFWYTYNLLDEGAGWAQAALDAGNAETQERGATLLTLGQMLQNLGRANEALDILQEASRIFEKSGNAIPWTETAIELGWSVYQMGQPVKSLAYFRRGCALAEQTGAPTLQAHALTSLTHVMLFEGAYTQELKGYIEESIRLCEESGDDQSRSHALLNLGTFYIQTGDDSAAIHTLRQARRSADATPNLSDLGWICASLAELLLMSDELVEVHALLSEALRLFEASNKGDGLMMVRHHLGELARKEGRWLEAETAFAESYRLAHSARNERMMARCLMGLGRVALAAGHLQTGMAQVEQAHTLLAAQPAFLPPKVSSDYDRAWQEVVAIQLKNGSGGNAETDDL